MRFRLIQCPKHLISSSSHNCLSGIVGLRLRQVARVEWMTGNSLGVTGLRSLSTKV